MKIGLLGIGNVGSAVKLHLDRRSDMTIKKILVRRERSDLGELATFSFDDILNDPEIDTVVELIGGIQPAYDYILSALKAGKNVVTANKLLLSYHLEELLAAALESGVHLKFDASVGGGIPFLFNLMRNSRADKIRSLSGILNGTTNLILDTMQSNGASFTQALSEAQRLGFAEADPSADIDGIDSRSKLCISASVAFDCFVNPDDVAMSGIRNISDADIRIFKQLGLICRLLVRAECFGDGCISAVVEPTLLSPSAPESQVHRCDNLVGLDGEYTGIQYFYGQGIGQNPTAFAVVSGLADISDHICLPEKHPPRGRAHVDNSRIIRRYYIRTSAPLDIAAEKIGNGCYLTEPIPVSRMHALAESMRIQDPGLFFAGIRE